jgi:hypothetical protein
MKRWLLLLLAAPVLVCRASTPWMAQPAWLHCGHDERKKCSADDGHADAARLAAGGNYVFFVLAGPVVPQEPIEITVNELKKVGIGAWFTSDTFERDRTAYIDAFNATMEKAFDARHGPRVLQHVRKRTDARIGAWMKAIDARDSTHGR